MSAAIIPATGQGELVVNKEAVEQSATAQPASEDGTFKPQKPTFFRSTLFQILVVGICAFCAPGSKNSPKTSHMSIWLTGK